MARSWGVTKHSTKHVVESRWASKTWVVVGTGAWISFTTNFCNLTVQVPCHLIFLKWLYFLPELYKVDSTKHSFFSYAVSSSYSSSSWLRWSQALVSFNLLLNLAESAFLQELLAPALHWSGSRTSLPTYELLQDAHQGTTVAAKPCSFVFLNTWIIYCYVNNISWWTFKFFPFLDYSEHSSNEHGRAYISRVLRVCT